MQRYFAKEKNNDNLILYDSDMHHIKKVMRCNINDSIEVIHNQIVYICIIKSLDPFKIEISNIHKEEPELKIDLTVAVSLVNEQKIDLILQKLTELGANKIIPVKTERSIVKIDEKKAIKKIERWQTICKEASEQSHRIKIPIVTPIYELKDLINIKTNIKLVCSLNEKSKGIDEYLNNKLDSILFIIGPEGGFTNKEEEYLLENNFKPISLGKRVLRVETAAIYVASIINYIYGG